MSNFSSRSNAILSTCHPDLQKLFKIVVEHYDCTILEGHRDNATQDELFNAGKSKVKAGFSKHNVYPSSAVDASPYPIPKNWGADNNKELLKFYQFAGIVIGISKMIGVKIRWGGDWDGDGDFNDQTFDDLVHFEIVDELKAH